MSSALWEVLAIEEVHADRNFRVNLIRNGVERVVYFYRPIAVGDFVSLYGERYE